VPLQRGVIESHSLCIVVVLRNASTEQFFRGTSRTSCIQRNFFTVSKRLMLKKTQWDTFEISPEKMVQVFGTKQSKHPYERVTRMTPESTTTTRLPRVRARASAATR